jgi:hypothetical protein
MLGRVDHPPVPKGGPVMQHRISSLLAVIALLSVACGGSPENSPAGGDLDIVPDIEARRAQFMPQELSPNIDHLSNGDRAALGHLIEAARMMDDIFLRQAWEQNPEFNQRVDALTGPHADAAKDYYRIMVGPWDRLKSREPFIGNVEHPEGAGYYPEDMTKEEFEDWISAHPEDEKAFKSLHTVIRREGDRLVAIPYSSYYREFLEDAAAHLRAAGETTTSPSLRTFLNSRADAFLSDDYYQSDMDWMDLTGDLEIVIGPYETYEDELFGYKAAFEAFLCVVDPDDSAALTKYKGELPWLERHLPIPDEHKNLDRGSESPIRVADEVFTAGDTRAGVQTIAFNLPNDERVREAKGSKKVLLKNVMRAKYDAILLPIAHLAIPADQQDKVTFDSYFNFVLFHELSHGLGPGRIMKDGRETEVRLELKDLYSALEEAKADVMGMWALYELADKGVVDRSITDNLASTVVPGLFRSARFGVTEAHGLGVVCQFSYLMEKGAMQATADGRLAPVASKWRDAVRDLCTDLTMLQANADYDAARAWVDKYGKVPPVMQQILDGLSDIPVDVDPVYSGVGALEAQASR